MELLDNVIQEYAWGSHHAIAQLLGQPAPTFQPQAELWLGAHPSAPSRLSTGRSLLDVIAQAPERWLGAKVSSTFGQRLPFLLKVLAAEAPLSLQAHPTLAQAQEGFARENALGIPLNAAERNYRDDNHKPELICALSPFDALCGFRPANQTLSLLERLQRPSLKEAIATLQRTPGAGGLRDVFFGWMRLAEGARARLIAEVLDACHRVTEGPFAKSCRWAVALARRYPADVGVACSLLLHCVTLQPGQALFLPAGNLHAYLHGVGVEVMASSDNVLRGGLTPKHVDVNELLRVLDFNDAPLAVLEARSSGDCEVTYDTPAREFRLSRFELRPGGAPVAPRREGPEILLCTEGAVEARTGPQSLTLSQGSSAFVAADEPGYFLAGEGVLFRATVGDTAQ